MKGAFSQKFPIKNRIKRLIVKFTAFFRFLDSRKSGFDPLIDKRGGFMNKYLWRPLRTKYGSFRGRAPRAEYFSIVIFSFTAAYGLTALFGFLAPIEVVYTYSPMLPYLFQLIFGIPMISVGVRRLHDTGRSGWWFWIMLLPVAGFIWHTVLMFLKGDKGDNEYGPDPLEPEEEAPFPYMESA